MFELLYRIVYLFSIHINVENIISLLSLDKTNGYFFFLILNTELEKKKIYNIFKMEKLKHIKNVVFFFKKLTKERN